MMTRKENWPEALADFIKERLDRPFQWGVQDCCLFSADAVLAMTGEDFAADYRGKYATALGAMRLVQPDGGVEGAFCAAAERIGYAVKPVAYAQRGDVMLYDTEHGPALGVCLGAQCAFPGPSGLAFVPIQNCRRAWGIG